MAQNILIVLKRYDLIEEIIPYIEQVARPGMRVIFLMRYPLDGFGWLFACLGSMETETRSVLGGRKMGERFSWQGQTRLAEKRVSPARKALCGKGVEVAVTVYTGRLRTVLQDYTRSGDVHLIMMPARSLPVVGVLRVPLQVFKRPGLSSVLLLHPLTERSK